jgi:hypothetical protein
MPRLALKGYDPVAYFTTGATPGLPEFEYLWDGLRYRVASAENLRLFRSHPDRYAPHFGGSCAMNMANARGRSADLDQFRRQALCLRRTGRIGSVPSRHRGQCPESWLQLGASPRTREPTGVRSSLRGCRRDPEPQRLWRSTAARRRHPGPRRHTPPSPTRGGLYLRYDGKVGTGADNHVFWRRPAHELVTVATAGHPER